jgi:hypothetical protein
MDKRRTRLVHGMVLAVTGTIVCMFNACGPGGFHTVQGDTLDLSSLTGNNCTVALKTIYANTYFPLLSQNCNTCHSANRGSTDINVSFDAFQSYGKTLIDYQATHPHQGNGIDLTPQIASVQSDWSTGQSAYDSCTPAP